MRLPAVREIHGRRRSLLTTAVVLAIAAALQPANRMWSGWFAPAPSAGLYAAEEPADSAAPADAAARRHQRGRVVWLAEALRRQFGIITDEDAAHSQIALETTDGELVPLAKDARGRAFWIDPRLAELDLELELRQPVGSPLAQVIRVYAWHGHEQYEVDYWCDICAIPMYEQKPCECCQGETRIRQRLVKDLNQEWQGS